MTNETKTGIVTHMNDSRNNTYLRLDDQGDYYFFNKANKLYRNLMCQSFREKKVLTIEVGQQLCISKMEIELK